MGIKTVQDSSLTAVADAIRAKTGKSASMEFPTEFVSEIGSIGGGGGGVEDTFAKICNGTIDSYESEELEHIPSNVLRSINNLKRMIIPNCKDISSYGAGGFRGSVIALPGFVGNTYSAGFAFNGSTTLQVVDFGTKISRLYDHFFNGATNLDTLIIRKTSIPTMHNASALSNTKFKSGGTGGTIYIPKALYDHLGDGSSSDYKAATNWSTIDGYGTITWAQIEGSIYETQYADGTPIPTT